MREILVRELSGVVVAAMSTGLLAAVASGASASAVPGVSVVAPPPPPIQTPVLTISRACRMTKGGALTFALTKTGAWVQTDALGNVVSYFPAIYAIGDSTFTHMSGRYFNAARVGGTIWDRVGLPGTYRVGQLLQVKATVDYSGDTTYAPSPAPVTVTVKSCDAPPRAWFDAFPGDGAHQLDLSADESLGNGLSYTWQVRRGKGWVGIGRGATMKHTFPSAGRVTIRLVVKDRSGRSAKYARTIRVM